MDVSYLLCGSGVVVIATGWWIYCNLPQVLITAIDVYVDAKYYLWPPLPSEEPNSELGACAPKLENTIVPTEIFETSNYRFALYPVGEKNFIGWNIKSGGSAPPQPPWVELITNPGAMDPQVEIIRGTSGLTNEQTLELTSAIQQFAGPAGDFGGHIPTTNVLSEYLGYTVDALLLTNEFMEEIWVRSTG